MPPIMSIWQVMLRRHSQIILSILFLILLSMEEKCGVSSFTPYQRIGSRVTAHRLSSSGNLSASTSEPNDVKTNSGANVPFFANTLGGGAGSFFASTPSPTKSTSSEAKAASITTRVPLGTLFDSRDYIFETLTNVRGYEWTIKVAEELLDDFIDASRGFLGELDEAELQTIKQDYELSQIVLVPMDWDREKYGIGNRYDVFDGQQRLVSLCLIFAALRESFLNDKGMEDTVTELSNMLKPPKVRKEDIVRIKLHTRDNSVLSHILNSRELDVFKDVKTLTRANKRILENYQKFTNRLQEMDVDERIKLLDFMVENVYILVCIPETPVIARNLVTAQGKGMDNEPIDDFKGLVCFRYTQDEENMYKTFDNWDHLASTPDLDNGAVGRETVSDACQLRATTVLRTKIRKRDILLNLERWLRRDVIQNKREGHIFFKKKIEPASLTLGQYRTGDFHLLGFYSRSKDTKIWASIAMRLNFLRLMTNTVSSVKDLEMVILDLLLRACGTEGDGLKMSLKELDQQLHGLEILALWMALSKPSASKRYEKCFEFLDAIENGENDINLITQQEKSMIREALVVTEFGSTASQRKMALAIMKRINCYVEGQKGDTSRLIESTGDHHLELILPEKATKKAWGHTWPNKDERDKWVYRIGNFAIVTNKPTAIQAKMPFAMKKERYQKEDWPLTAGLAELEEWDSNMLIKHLAKIVSLIDNVWAL